MTFTEQEQEKFCSKIIKRRDIRNYVVVLCEGNPTFENLYNPQQISKLERIPDANFWKSTIPKWWNRKQPKFIPCGGRSSVLSVYAQLREIHNSDPENSYLNPEKLFALVDLDLQPCPLLDFCDQYPDIEDLYYATYQNYQVCKEAIWDSHILVTGWSHKESYFLEPDLISHLQAESEYTLYWDQDTLLANDIYKQIAKDLPIDNDYLKNGDLKKYFNRAFKRISSCFKNPVSNPDKLSEMWLESFNQCMSINDLTTKRKLIDCLLTIGKAKPYWENKMDKKITITHQYQVSNEQALRDSLILAIGKFYGDRTPHPSEAEISNIPYHIPHWVYALWECEQQSRQKIEL